MHLIGGPQNGVWGHLLGHRGRSVPAEGRGNVPAKEERQGVHQPCTGLVFANGRTDGAATVAAVTCIQCSTSAGAKSLGVVITSESRSHTY